MFGKITKFLETAKTYFRCLLLGRSESQDGERIVTIRMISFSLDAVYLSNSWRFIWCEFAVNFINGFFVLWHINLCRLFNAKAILLEEQYCYYLTRNWEDKGVHTVPKGICPKVNVIVWLEYELAYYDFALTITPRGHPRILLSNHDGD